MGFIDRGLIDRFRAESVRFPQPPTQINGAATFGAKRVFRPLVHRPGHWQVTNVALVHRLFHDLLSLEPPVAGAAGGVAGAAGLSLAAGGVSAFAESL